jgi:hypothetical protein
MTQTFFVRVVWCVGVLFCVATVANARVPALEWDPNTEPAIAGYNVYVGETSGTYTHVVDVGVETRFPLTNLSSGVTHYFAVTAYDVNGLESPFSEEIWYTPRIDGTNSVLLPISIIVSPVGATIRFLPQGNQVCRIVASADLVHWEQIHSTTGSITGVLQIQDVILPGRTKRFYRVVGTP